MAHGYSPRSAKKRGASLLTLTFRCETLDREVVVPLNKLTFAASSGECDLCGSHGVVTTNFLCECGKYHDVELSSW